MIAAAVAVDVVGCCDTETIGNVVGRAVEVSVLAAACGLDASCAASNAVIVLVVFGGAKFNGCWFCGLN